MRNWPVATMIAASVIVCVVIFGVISAGRTNDRVEKCSAKGGVMVKTYEKAICIDRKVVLE